MSSPIKHDSNHPHDADGSLARGESADRGGLWALYGAEGISVTGNRVASLAIPWFVYEMTGSAAKTGLSGFAEALPLVIGGVLGGTAVDLIGARRSSIMADVASGLSVLCIPLLYFTVGLAFWQLLLLVFFGALMDAPGVAARRALIPTLAADASWSLDRATSIHDGVFRTGGLFGGPLAGVLIAAFGAATALGANAITFLVSALAVAIWVPRPAQVPNSQPREAGSIQKTYWKELLQGLGFIRKHDLVRSIMGIFMVSNMIDNALFAVILPIYMNEVHDSAIPLGIAVAILGACGGASSFLYGWIWPKGAPRWMLPLCMVAAGPVKFFVLGTTNSLGAIYAAMAVTGIGAGPINPILRAIQYRAIPKRMHARVFGLVSAGVMVGVPISAAAAGYSVEFFGLETSLITLGLAFLVLAFVPILSPHWRAWAATS